jgi:Zn-dependent peptidase ImmA (M78 family)
MRWEADDRQPGKAELDAIVDVLGFPVQFFMGSELDVADSRAASFRSMSSMTARERDGALASGSLGFLAFDWIEDRFNLPEPDLEDLRHETPEGAARALREKWLIGERPISNMIALLESKGVRVCSLAEEVRSVDAFSMWRRKKPYAFLNSYKSAEHQRFDAAHELGHLVLHQHGAPRGREAEEEANRFASAFLMPAADVRAHIPIVYGINSLIRAKKRWRVSVAALNYRVHRLHLTTEWEYRGLCIEIQKAGYRTREPESIERETSQVWNQVFLDLRERGMSKADLAESLSIPPREIDNLVFGLVSMLPLEGGRSGSGHSTGKLRLVD